MLVNETLMSDLEKEAKKFREVLDSLKITDRQKRKLIEQMQAANRSYQLAWEYASNLPATLDCDEYAKDKIQGIWKKYLGDINC